MDPIEKERRIADFVGRRVWAVVGASQDRRKFGNRIYRSLRDAGYTVYPVNPKGGELEGAKVYPELAALWMQPGAESETAIQYCQEHAMEVIYDACAMVHKRQWN